MQHTSYLSLAFDLVSSVYSIQVPNTSSKPSHIKTILIADSLREVVRYGLCDRTSIDGDINLALIKLISIRQHHQEQALTMSKPSFARLAACAPVAQNMALIENI